MASGHVYIDTQFAGDLTQLAFDVRMQLLQLTGLEYEVDVRRHPKISEGRAVLVLDGGLLR